jgi:Xaa-Pro aminopeptidase
MSNLRYLAPSTFSERRKKAAQKAGRGALLIPSAPDLIRNDDVHHPFRQSSNLFYLTGFPEPESFLVIAPRADGTSQSTLFVRKNNPEREIWDGRRFGVDGALASFGVDATYPIEELALQLPALLKHSEKIYYRTHKDEAMDRLIFGALETLRRGFGRSGRGLSALHDPSEILGEMRLFKAPEEIAALKKAGSISAESHRDAMLKTRPGMNEFEVEALIDYGFRSRGCQRLGYGSIVAGGVNATCLHYHENNQVLRDGDLLLIDAGGEFDFYTADITRTFPIGKKFSAPQRKLYDLVLKSQLDVIAMVKPGLPYAKMHEAASMILIEGLLSLGLMKGKAEEIFKTDTYRRFYPHGTGHYLGMDVHDCGLYLQNGEPRVLEPGMCFTIEPGLYVQPTDRDAPAEFKDIGIRIEDDILVTATGCEVMTSGVPKAVDEIEALRSQSH